MPCTISKGGSATRRLQSHLYNGCEQRQLDRQPTIRPLHGKMAHQKKLPAQGRQARIRGRVDGSNTSCTRSCRWRGTSPRKRCCGCRSRRTRARAAAQLKRPKPKARRHRHPAGPARQARRQPGRWRGWGAARQQGRVMTLNDAALQMLYLRRKRRQGKLRGFKRLSMVP